MNTRLNKIIESVGLEQKQARVYLATLELGSGSVMEIAKKAEVERVNTYYVLEQLMHEGIISVVYKEGRKRFEAVSPKSLLDKAEANIGQFKSALPELLSISNTEAGHPSIQYFEGKEGMGEILKDMIESMKDLPEEERLILEYVNPEMGLEALREEQLEFIKKRIKHKIRLKWISPDTELAKKMISESEGKYREMRLVPAEKFSLSCETNIYGNKINMIGEKGAMMGVIIEHSAMAQTQREIFELAWEGASGYGGKLEG